MLPPSFWLGGFNLSLLSRVGRPVVPDVPSPLPIDLDPRRIIIAASFGLLDEVCLKDEFNHRAHVFEVVPFVVRGAFRGAMWLAFEEILEGHEVHSNTRMSRGWKLLMLLPRMLLHRPSDGGHISRKQVEERFRRFQEGEWLSLLREGQGCCSEAQCQAQGVILAYMCVKLQMRLYVCQAPCPLWVHFGSILGPFWVHFGSILGPFWVHFGSILGPFWVHFESILSPFWVHFGSIV